MAFPAAPPCTGALPDNAAEGPIQCRLVGKAALYGDFSEREAGIQEQGLHSLYTLLH
jgi:hypothetical protein